METNTVRTSRADRNYLSWSGDTLQWYLGTDHPEPCERVPEEVYPAVLSDWESALKVSGNACPIYVNSIRAAQCNENVLDINHSHEVSITGEFGRLNEVGDQVITIKGGSSSITLAGMIGSRGRSASVVIGQWSDQSFEPSRYIDLTGLRSANGPLTVILSRCDRKTIKLPPEAKVLEFKSIAFKLYWWAKWLAVKAGLFGK